MREFRLPADPRRAIVEVGRLRAPGASVTQPASSAADQQTRQIQIDELTREHRRLDTMVRELERRIVLSPAEQLEISQLKKQKLLTKDKLARLTS
jgi:uncharacterized protein YdcH (DUF465 family)